jgi:hypothetical protein
MRKFSILLCLLALTALPVFANDDDHSKHKSPSKTDAQIHGEYLESRNADVWVGACYANSEIGLVGDQAIMAWRIAGGSWNGVKLDGLSVVGVVKAAATLGSTYSDPYPAKAILIFDSKASDEQRVALTAFVKAMGGKLYETIVTTMSAPISFEMQYHGEHPTVGTMKAGELAAIRTRLVNDKDHLCGHEDVAFEPLAPTLHSMASVALTDSFKGIGLGVSWAMSDKRSAFVGTFAR